MSEIPRRRFLREVTGGGAALAAGLLPPHGAQSADGAAQAGVPAQGIRPSSSGGLFAYVGGFNAKDRNEHGEGISVYRVDPAGRWTLVHLVRDVINPGYLIVDRSQRFLYAAHARIDKVSAYAIDRTTGLPTLLNTESTGGVNPVHLAIDPTGRHLVLANYAGGNVAVVPIRADGGLGPRTDLVTLSGELGPHRGQQTTAHPHHCPFDRSGRFVVVPDKGLERVFVFRLDPASGRLVAADKPFVVTRSGAGPRHVDFHPTLARAYVVNELESTVATYRWGEDGGLEPMQAMPTIPPAFTGENTGSEVVVSRTGRLVFVSNRGHDSVGVFAVDAKSGVLSPSGWESTRGATPRFIGLSPSGSHLFAANQATDTIVAWRVDEAAGRLSATSEVVKVGCPTAIAFAAPTTARKDV